MPRLAEDVLYVLENNLVIDSAKKTILINTKLDPALYDAVAALFGGLGGRWVGKVAKGGRHRFPADPKPIIDLVLMTGEDNPNDFFGTSDDVADYMAQSLDIASLPKGAVVLEPNFGFGPLTRAVIRAALKLKRIDLRFHAVDINQGLIAAAKAKPQAGHTYFCTNFLTWTPPIQYDAVIMNPPFGVRASTNTPAEPDYYIRHIIRAWANLKPGGRLVTIAPPGWTFREERAKDWQMPYIDADTILRAPQFRTFVERYGTHVKTAQGVFKSSGTDVAVTIILLSNDPERVPQIPALPAALAPEEKKPKPKSKYEDLTLEELTRDLLKLEHASNVAMHNLMTSLAPLMIGEVPSQLTSCVTCGQPVSAESAYYDARKRRWHPKCAEVRLSLIDHVLDEAREASLEQAA